MHYWVIIDSDLSNLVLYFGLFPSMIFSCYSIGTCRYSSELKSFCEIVFQKYGTTLLEPQHFTVLLPLTIFLRDTVVLYDLILEKHNNKNWYYWKMISSFTYHFIRRNKFTLYIQVYFRGIWIRRKYDNIVTMSCRIMSINITIISFINDQRHFHNIVIK